MSGPEINDGLDAGPAQRAVAVAVAVAVPGLGFEEILPPLLRQRAP